MRDFGVRKLQLDGVDGAWLFTVGDIAGIGQLKLKQRMVLGRKATFRKIRESRTLTPTFIHIFYP
jgi:hypothetical protein